MSRKITRAVARIALGLRTSSTWATWTPAETGATPATTCGRCTSSSSRSSRTTMSSPPGSSISVREFVTTGLREVGIELAFRARAWTKSGVVQAWTSALLANGMQRIRTGGSQRSCRVRSDGPDSRSDRPALFPAHRGPESLGDASKARRQLGWEPTVTFAELLREMVAADLIDAQKYDCVQASGLPVTHRHDS